jgi:hypothetical protein
MEGAMPDAQAVQGASPEEATRIYRRREMAYVSNSALAHGENGRRTRGRQKNARRIYTARPAVVL